VLKKLIARNNITEAIMGSYDLHRISKYLDDEEGPMLGKVILFLYYFTLFND
jgi:hypothetical protein